MHCARAKKLSSMQKYTEVVLSYSKDSKEVPAYREMTEEQQIAHKLDSREMTTSSMDRTAQTPILLFN